MKLIERGLYVAGLAFMLWILISWADVLCHNAPGEKGTQAEWNAFVLLMKEAE